MDRKKIIMISVLVFASIVAIAFWLKSRPTAEQKAFADKFANDMKEGAKNKKGVAPRKTLNPSTSSNEKISF